MRVVSWYFRGGQLQFGYSGNRAVDGSELYDLRR